MWCIISIIKNRNTNSYIYNIFIGDANSDDTFRSILNSQHTSPLPFSSRALTPMRISQTGSNTSSVLFELLLDITKNCIPEISNKKFCEQLVSTISGSTV